MRNLFFPAVLVLTFTSCVFLPKGNLVNGECRPKKANFKLFEMPFKESKALFFNSVYLADNYAKSSGYGFYPDGRLVCFNSADGLSLEEKDIAGRKWDTAVAIGYWRVDGNKIQIEYFVCQDGGFYNVKHGDVKGDTITFSHSIYHPTRKEVRKERYVVSEMRFDL